MYVDLIRESHKDAPPTESYFDQAVKAAPDDCCFEEGAKEFLLKPVKLSDVKRLTDFMRGEGKKREKRSQKRRRSNDCCPSLSTSFSSISHPCDLSSPELSSLSPSALSSKKSRL